MKPKLRTAALAFFLLAAGLLDAQTGPVLKLVHFRHDFGPVLVKDGPVKHVFPVQNAGTDTLEIIKLKTSGVNVTGEMLPHRLGPGDKGEIIVTFDPANEKGKVEKFVSIRSNDPQYPVRQLSFMAEVMERPLTIRDHYPVQLGNLRLKAKHIVMDQLFNTDVRTDTFYLFNDWTKPMKLSIHNPQAHVAWNFLPETLEPGAEGKLVVTYDAAKSENWGLNLDQFILNTNDVADPMKVITIGVNIMEDFSYMKQNPAHKPRILVDPSGHDFGEVKKGARVSHTYLIQNQGVAKLIIRKVKPGCGCTVADLEKSELEPGETSRLKIEFDASGMVGKQVKSISIVTNDPERSLMMLSFSATVVE